MFLNLQRNKNFCVFLSLIFKLISAVRQGDAAREDLWIFKILRYIIFFLNFLCFNDFYNKFLQYAKEIAQEDIGLFNNFALLTKKIFHCLLYSIFVSVCQGDAAREDSAGSGPGDRPDHVWSSGGGWRFDWQPLSGQGPHPPLVRNVHPRHGVLRIWKQPSHS